MDYTVRDEDDFARVYDEDDSVTIRKGDLRALLDVAVTSMDFGSCFLDNEQVEALRKACDIIGIDPLYGTPSNFLKTYGPRPDHRHIWFRIFNGYITDPRWVCKLCHHEVKKQPPGWTE